jgi:hypothetical protein
LRDVFLDSPEPILTRLTRDSQGPRHAAPSHPLDVTMAASLFSEDLWDIPE